SQDFLDSVVSVLYIAITPLLNSIIYILRKKAIQMSLDNYIYYVFCDVPSILKLACVDVTVNELVIMIYMGFIAITSLFLIVASYAYIIRAILKISSTEGRHRTFSTCTPILLPESQDSMDSVVSMFYTTITPLLNPLIYTLRNKEMKNSLLKLWHKNTV
ncbi:hypothetical protein E2320_003497, partial [Naja naja]